MVSNMEAVRILKVARMEWFGEVGKSGKYGDKTKISNKSTLHLEVFDIMLTINDFL